MTTAAGFYKLAATQQADNKSVEQAFFQQAYTFIQNKAGDFLLPQHRLGFEIVHRSEDNTRLAGIFGFRSQSELFYCPVFFINSEIKGTDLLYRRSTKKFCRLSPDRAKALLAEQANSSGMGVDRSMSRQVSPRMELHKLVYPSRGTGYGTVKFASVADAPTAQELFAEFEKAGSIEPVFADFVADMGFKALDWMEAMVKRSSMFAQAVDLCITDEMLQPPGILEKLAAQNRKTVTPVLSLFVGGLLNDPDVDAQVLERGYALLDKRAAADISTVTEDDKKMLETVSKPGMCSVLGAHGKFVDGFAGYKLNVTSGASRGGGVCCPPPLSDYSLDSVNPAQSFRFIGKDGGVTCWEGDVAVMTEPRDDVGEPANFTFTPKVGDGFAIILDKERVSQPMYLERIEHPSEGITVYHYRDGSYIYNSDADAFYVNSGLSASRPDEGIFAEKEIQFIPVQVKKLPEDHGQARLDWSDFTPAKMDQVYALLQSEGFNKAAVHRSGSRYAIREGDTTSPWLSRLQAHIKMARDLRIDADEAYRLLGVAEKEGTVGFMLKRSSSIRLADDPQFDLDEYDDDLGVRVETPQGFAIQTITDQDLPADQRLGDAWDPTMGHGPQSDSGDRDGLSEAALLSSDPDQLAGLARVQGLPHVFEHGTVSSMIDTFDATAQLDKYLPKLEDAVDALGRSLFLFYWKPGDFETSFGTDDMQELENIFLSAFKLNDDLALKLSQKSIKRRESAF